MRIIRCLFVTLLMAITSSGSAQTALQKNFENLQIGTALPEDLQSSRSAVFLKVDQIHQSDTIDWSNLAEEFHKSLTAMYIDAVAYYRWQDLNAGYDANISYLEALIEREINQIILLEAALGDYEIYIVPTDLEAHGLFDTTQPAWHTRGNTLEEAVENLASMVRRTDLEVGNFLISGSPELFYDTEIFTKNRFESYQPDLKLDKLAAPLFYSDDVEDLEQPWDQELNNIMHTQYPFAYELVSPSMTEDLMMKAGFQYVLRYLHGEERILRTLLDYPSVDDHPDQMVYKYYIKHLITGDIYLGDAWDSQPEWQQALMIHLTRLRRSLKVE